MEDLLGREKQPTVLGVNLVYLSVLFLMLVSQVILANWMPGVSEGQGYYWRMFILELVLIGGPPLVYMIINRMDISRVTRFNPIKPVEVFLVLGMAIFGYGIMIIINLIWFWIASHWGTPMGQELPAIENGKQLLAAVLAIGLVPAVVEEFLFRGLILRGYEKFGSRIAIVMTGILFGMLHLQLMSIPSIILLGIVITYVVYRTNSIFAGMIYHFVHNTITIGFLFIQNAIIENPGVAGAVEGLPQDISQLPKEALTIAFIVWGVIGFFAIILFIACIAIFHRYTQNRTHLREVSEREMGRSNFLEMLPAIIATIIVIINLVFEVLYMTGVLSI